MHLPLTRPDPDPHLQADTPAHPWLVPISKQVPSTQDCGCPSLPWLPRISNWGCGIGSGWLRSCPTSPGDHHTSCPQGTAGPHSVLANTGFKLQLFGVNGFAHFCINMCCVHPYMFSMGLIFHNRFYCPHFCIPLNPGL